MNIGADRCKAGGLIVMIDEAIAWHLDIAFRTTDLWEKYAAASLILLDIPIGLRESGTQERLCDPTARRVLGPRASSVFPAPCRQALNALSYEEGSQWNQQVSGRK